MLFTTPLIAALKAHVPDMYIGYLGNARTEPLLRGDPRISCVFRYERDEFVALYRRSPWQFVRRWQALVTEMRAKKFDLALDCSLGSPVSAALFWAGIPRRIGYDYKGRGRWLTDRLAFKGYEGRHVAEYVLDLLGHAGLPCRVPGQDAWPMRVFPSAEDEEFARSFMREHHLRPGRFVAVYPGGGASWGQGAFQKRWPAREYAKLADKVVEKSSLAIILMGDCGEKELCAAVAGAMKFPAVNAAGGTSLLQSAALMRQARFVLANDGGPLHVAVASGARTVSVFGPVDPVVYGPFPSAGHTVVQKKMACQPCYRRFRMSDCRHLGCLRLLEVDELFNQLKELL